MLSREDTSIRSLDVSNSGIENLGFFALIGEHELPMFFFWDVPSPSLHVSGGGIRYQHCKGRDVRAWFCPQLSFVQADTCSIQVLQVFQGLSEVKGVSTNTG